MVIEDGLAIAFTIFAGAWDQGSSHIAQPHNSADQEFYYSLQQGIITSGPSSGQITVRQIHLSQQYPFKGAGDGPKLLRYRDLLPGCEQIETREPGGRYTE
jgi:hypothetical protein